MQDTRPYLWFVVVAEELSFTAAAARLGVAQPWLSARIRQLEARLGFALFSRTTRRVELTDKGQALLPSARAVAEAATQLEHAVHDLAGALDPLRIGAPAYAGRIPAVRRMIDAFRRCYPSIPVEMDVGYSHALLVRVAAGGLDAAFALGVEQREDLKEIVLDRFTLHLEMNSDDPLADGPLTPSTLAGRSLVVFDRGLHPHLFELLYGAIKAGGAHLMEAPYLASYNDPELSTQRLLITVPSSGRTTAPRPGRVRRRVEGVQPVAFKLLSGRGSDSASVARFWTLAEKLVREAPVAAAIQGDARAPSAASEAVVGAD